MKNVLYISYNFPPVGGSRVRRTLKFVKYLKSFGWNPVVLTAKKPVVPEYDFSLIDEVPDDIKVVRTNSFDAQWVTSVKRGIQSRLASEKSKSRTALEQVIEKIKWSLFIPDVRIAWIPSVVRSGLRIIKEDGIDVIFVSGEPFSSFLSGVFLKKLTGKPLIIEFRDEWTEFNNYFSFRTKPWWVKQIEKRLEKWVVEQSDKVITVTEAIVDNFRKRYHYLDRGRFTCITNGYDPADFMDVKRNKSTNKFVMTYAGALRQCRTPHYLFKAIEAWVKEDSSILEQIRFRYLGICEPDTQQLFAGGTVRGISEEIGFVDYRTTLAHLMDSDVLIYLEDQIEIADRICPAKLFEYMAVGQPIVALAQGKSVTEVIAKSGTGVVVPPKGVDEIKETLKALFMKYKSGELRFARNTEYIRKFDRCRLTNSLAEQLNEVLTNRAMDGFMNKKLRGR